MRWRPHHVASLAALLRVDAAELRQQLGGLFLCVALLLARLAFRIKFVHLVYLPALLLTREKAIEHPPDVASWAPSCFYTLRLVQDYGKFGVVDMDDKQKMFRLVKRLNTDPMRGTNNGVGDRGLQTPRSRNSQASGKDSPVDSLEAKLRAQMLDGNAALLSLADDSDDYLLQVHPHNAAQGIPTLCLTPAAIILSSPWSLAHTQL